MQLYVVRVNGELYPLKHNPIMYMDYVDAERCSNYFSEVGNDTQIIRFVHKVKHFSKKFYNPKDYKKFYRGHV